MPPFLVIGTQIRIEALPIASNPGRIAIEVDTGQFYRDSGNAVTGWIAVGGGGGGVSSVFGRVGPVVAQAGDYDAVQVDNTPSGGIGATNVQAALNELDAEKQPLNGTLTGIAAVAGDGILVKTGAGTAAVRTLVAGSGIGITNPDGVAGNPTIVATGGVVTSVFTRTGAVVATNGDYTAGQVTNVPAGGISAVTVQTALDELDGDKQPLSANLTALAGVGANGILVRTSPSTAVARTLQAGTNITITNPDGVAGDPIINATGGGGGAVSSVFTRTGAVVAVAGDYDAVQVDNTPAGGISAITVQGAIDELDAEKQPIDADLTALAGLATTGLIARTGAGTAATRSVAVGGTAGLSVSNGDGVAGNPTINFGSTNDSNGRVAVNKNSGATVGTRRRINFIEGSNVTLTVADDAGNEEVDVTIAATGGGGGGGYDTIQEEGSGLTQRTTLNIIGPFVTAADDAGNTRTNLTSKAAGAFATQNTTNDVVSTAAETSLTSFTVAANALGSNGWLRLNLVGDYLNNGGSAQTLRVRVKFGGTTVWDSTTANLANVANRRTVGMTVVLANKNATNSQAIGGFFWIGDNTAPTTGLGSIGVTVGNSAAYATQFTGTDPAANTTSNQTLEVTVQHNASGANLSCRRLAAMLELWTEP